MFPEMIFIILYVLIIALKHDRDASRTNFNVTIASDLLHHYFISKHYEWFTWNLWKEEDYQKYKMITIPFVSKKTEWFLAKNILSFLNDYWKFCEFWLMLIVSFLLASFMGSYWLTIPLFMGIGLIHSFLDTSLLR